MNTRRHRRARACTYLHHTCMHMHVCSRGLLACTRPRGHTCMRTHVCTCSCAHASIAPARVRVCSHAHAPTPMCVCMCVHVREHAHAHRHTEALTHTFTRTCARTRTRRCRLKKAMSKCRLSFRLAKNLRRARPRRRRRGGRPRSAPATLETRVGHAHQGLKTSPPPLPIGKDHASRDARGRGRSARSARSFGVFAEGLSRITLPAGKQRALQSPET